MTPYSSSSDLLRAMLPDMRSRHRRELPAHDTGIWTRVGKCSHFAKTLELYSQKTRIAKKSNSQKLEYAKTRIRKKSNLQKKLELEKTRIRKNWNSQKLEFPKNRIVTRNINFL